MLIRKFRILRDAENGKAGASGAEGTGETGAGQPAAEPEEDKSINSKAKALPWVQKALAAEAKLSRLEAEQAEAKRKSEQTALEQRGQYEAALKLEQEEKERIKSGFDSEVKKLTLKAELAQAGFRPEAMKLFLDDFKPEEGTAEQFVSKLRKDASYEWLLVSDTKKRTPNPTKPAGQGPPEEFDPSWINSDDPQKKQAAVEHNRKAFWSKFHGKAAGDSR
jgi:hypothetical protein